MLYSKVTSALNGYLTTSYLDHFLSTIFTPLINHFFFTPLINHFIKKKKWLFNHFFSKVVN